MQIHLSRPVYARLMEFSAIADIEPEHVVEIAVRDYLEARRT